MTSPAPGRIVILNGPPRSGKSTLARAIEAEVPGHWTIWGVDAFNAGLSTARLPGIGLRPGGERPDLEAGLEDLFGAYFARLSAIARAGSDVVADLGLHRDYASGFDPMPLLTAALDGLDLLMVGIDCALPVIMARRNADPQNGLYAAGPGVPAPVARWQVAVHDGKHYDLRLDMGLLTPQQGAARIAEILFSRASLNLR